MTEAEYDAIAAGCDLLLRARDTSLERIAIPILHVVSEHPGWTAQYAAVLEAQRAGRFLPPRTLSADTRTAARVARAAWRCLKRAPQRRLPLLNVGAGSLLHRTVDVLIVSHLAEPSQIGRSADFYFGDIQLLLDERGVSSALVWVDHLRSADMRLACFERLEAPRRGLLPRYVAPLTEARIWRRCFAAAAILRREADRLPTSGARPGLGQRCTSDGLQRSLAALASRHAVYEATAANLRMHECVANCCRHLRPRIVITTHEGDACDRLIWHAARSADPSILCVGYQHTRMLSRAHAIRRSLRADGLHCDPDVILTVGEFTRSELSQCADLAPIRLITYGSHRWVDTSIQAPFGQRPRACVVLPDAYELETVLLFGFALDCARVNAGITFILRPHPAVDFPALLSRHARLRELPANVRVSTGTLEQECQAARYCLYRGSSAVVQALLCGVKPFYLARAGELRFDPLYALGEWREVISSTDEFLSRIVCADLAEPSAAQSAARARRLCDRYVSKVQPEALDELLALASRTTGRAPTRRATSAPVQ
ncbi:MAG TPA: hypothetical protein VN660_03095 [Steroidobacteraceae bacterium]|nr:hypothetical protein [Steroidobacteraceae bacterium]